MAGFLIACAAGLACGVISGFGIGGGSILMVYLTAVLALEQRAAQGVNLLYFLPTAAAALAVHAKNRQVDWRAVLPAALCGALSAGLAAILAMQLQGDALRKVFGGFLIIIGLAELFKRTKNNRSVPD